MPAERAAERAEENAARIRRAYEHLNAGEFDALADFIAADAVINGVPIGYAGWRQGIEALRCALPDVEVTVEEVLAVGDRVVTRHTVRGTHLGAWLGLPPTGRPVALAGLELLRLRDGVLVEAWDVVDCFGLLQQVGATFLLKPAPP